MPPADDSARRLAAMLASRADHHTVTTDRLAGTAEGVADLDRPPVAHLADGERPAFCFACHDDGVSVGDPDAPVAPERGGAFVFTDRRVLVQLGLASGDETRSVPYGALDAATFDPGGDRHRVELRVDAATYHLWIPGEFGREDVARAVEHATFQRKRASPDRRAGGPDGDAPEASPEDDTDADGPQTVRERLERLGDAKSRGLIDGEEFQRRKEALLDEHSEE
ncbi:SHOCT domain-containing protein [Halorussus halobius]|uniref:SHOCT domain-containing protein n=1 Tax=Halorussus halobius TaxID=1710537 RepID=UPI001092A2AE|nr:SHOCT domain-containing protein [Halorussus halobius]